jgi:hypothetical protein
MVDHALHRSGVPKAINAAAVKQAEPTVSALQRVLVRTQPQPSPGSAIVRQASTGSGENRAKREQPKRRFAPWKDIRFRLSP